jgi:hypothetical protein
MLRLNDAQETMTSVGYLRPLTLSPIMDGSPTLDDLFQERHDDDQSRTQFVDESSAGSAESRSSPSLSNSSGSTRLITPENWPRFAARPITRTNAASVLNARRLELVHVAYRHGYKGFPVISISGILIAHVTIKGT